MREGGQPLGCGDVLEHDLGPGPHPGQGVQGSLERGGDAVPARVLALVPGLGQDVRLHVRRVGRRLAPGARRAAALPDISRLPGLSRGAGNAPPGVWEDQTP